MRSFLTLFAVSVFTVVAFTFSTNISLADQPLDVDCLDLEMTIIDVDDALDAAGVEFKSLGQLLVAAKKDEMLFQDLSMLIALFSETNIVLDTPSQTVTTIAKCGLIDLLNQNIKD